MLHSALRIAARTRLTRPFSHAASLSRYDSGSSSASKDYPINVIETQQSLRTLSSLLHEGNLPSARQLLADILDSSNGLDTYRQVCRRLRHKDLLLQVALTAAEKGYTHFAREEVLPLLAADVRAQVEQELLRAEEQVQQHTPLPRVFEDNSADYPAPAPPRPSTLDLIQAHLPDLLPEPTKDDCSLFEDAATPVFAQSPTAQTNHITNTSVGLLDRTLLAGRYEDAHALLVDMYELGVPIPPSPKYAYVALALLQSAAPTALLTPQQSDRVAAWLALIPPLNRTTRENWPQTRTVLALLDTHFLRTAATPDTRTAARLLAVLASLGYVDKFQRLTDVTVRSLGPARLPAFLAAVDAASVLYTTRGELPDDKLVRVRTIFRNRVVQSLILARRADEAVPLLVDIAHGAWTLYKPTLKLLHDAAAYSIAAGHPDAPIPQALELLGQSASSSATSLSDAEHAALEEQQPAVEPEVDFGGSAVLAARYLRAMLATRTRVPHSKSIAAFMEMYVVHHGRTRILHALFRQAHSQSQRHISTKRKGGTHTHLTANSYALAEMLFYHRHKLYELVVETFVDHFYLFGVDRNLVMERYAAYLARRAENPRKYPARVTFPPPPPTSTTTTTTTTNASTSYFRTTTPFAGAKLFPEDTHRTLLWHALIRITPRAQRKDVYLSFLSLTRSHHAILSSSTPSPSSPSSPSPTAPHRTLPSRLDLTLGALSPPSARFTPASFTPFLEPLIARYGPRAGWRVVRDMLEVGMTPHVHVYTELARVCAREGEEEAVFEVVGRLEGVGVGVGGERAGGQGGEYVPRAKAKGGEPMWVQFPEPDMPFYISILRGFILARNLRAAERIIEHVERWFPGTTDGEAESGQRGMKREREMKREMTDKERRAKEKNEALYAEALRDLERLREEVAEEAFAVGLGGADADAGEEGVVYGDGNEGEEGKDAAYGYRNGTWTPVKDTAHDPVEREIERGM